MSLFVLKNLRPIHALVVWPERKLLQEHVKRFVVINAESSSRMTQQRRRRPLPLNHRVLPV